MNILTCPRCGEHKLELMKSYCFCWECGYSPEDGQSSAAEYAVIHKFFQKDPVGHVLDHIMERAS